ncbi:MAG TPA: ribonuclease HII [Aliidongia sp.]|uniref:ribonuclease HII n=1 Tax=Aliidongia sp. TaxID=1914230 RepID=UPI002DDC9580|nr:ribonuclease HII [Aliidongia sp.]HEV2673825.1 ribonuclease HII [Aliidongia sp.]
MPDLSWEIRLGGIVAGVDEVGRGPLAGPVVAAAVILDPANLPRELDGLDDSKVLSAEARAHYVSVLRRVAIIGIGAASVDEIDRINILQASMLAMARAVARLSRGPDVALIDGNRAPKLSCRAVTLVKGDTLSLSIAAASVVAKETRDRAMVQLHARYPGYGWASNVGYPTAAHRAALGVIGLTRHHRRSFGPVRALLGLAADEDIAALDAAE